MRWNLWSWKHHFQAALCPSPSITCSRRNFAILSSKLSNVSISVSSLKSNVEKFGGINSGYCSADPNQTPDKDKIILGRSVVEHVLTDKKVAYPAAKLSVAVIDVRWFGYWKLCVRWCPFLIFCVINLTSLLCFQRDKSGGYLDSVMNTCQMLYQTKKTSALADTVKFMAFVVFLQEMYTEVK